MRITFLACFTAAALTGCSSSSRAPSSFSSYLQSQAESNATCDSSVEGSFVGTLASPSRSRVRITLLCKTRKNLVGSITIFNGAGNSKDLIASLRLPYALVKDNEAIFTSFPFDPELREVFFDIFEETYLKLDYAELKKGKLRGKYLSGNLKAPLAISAERTQVFPVFQSSPIAIPKSWLNGYYKLPGDRGITIDDLLGSTLLNLHIGVDTIHMMDWTDGSGTGIFSSSSMVKGLFHVRGRVLDENHVEVYIINPIDGITGPYVGTKTVP